MNAQEKKLKLVYNGDSSYSEKTIKDIILLLNSDRYKPQEGGLSRSITDLYYIKADKEKG